MKLFLASVFLLFSADAFADGWRQARGNEVQESHNVAAALLHSLNRSSCDDKQDFIRSITQVVLGNHTRVMKREIESHIAGTSTAVTERKFQVTLNDRRVFYFSIPDDIGESVTMYLTDGQDSDTEPDGACRFTMRAYRD